MANHLNRFIDDDDMSGSSIDRNEHYDQYSTMNSPLLIDTNNNNTNLINKNYPNEPKIGLKIVLKRQSGNNYQVTNQLSTLLPASSSFSTSSSLSSGTRPKRAASRKVKFRFSDNESGNENDGSPVRKKPKITHVINNNYSILNTNVKQIKKRQTNIQKPINIQHHQLELQETSGQIITNNKKIIEPEPLKETLISFDSKDIVESSFETKAIAFNSKAFVLIEHSKPFPICLVEDKTNIVYTKALLFIHLFQTFSSPCIVCPLCKNHLNVTEFSKHIHKDDEYDDEEESDQEYEKKSTDSDTEQELEKKSYKILPYITKNNELSEADLNKWKLFGKRFSQFKQESQVKLNESKQVITNQSINVNNKKEEVEIEKSKEILEPKEKTQFNDWDYVNTNEKIYMLTDKSIDLDQIIYLNKNGEENVANKENNIILKRQDSDDLNLSESEDTDDQDENLKLKTKQLVAAEKHVDNVESHELKAQVNKKELKPTVKELYFNLYDNASKDKLFYIVDNQYTIIPDSYIIFINRKREIYFQQLKLANSLYFQKKWLNLSLDLEFSIN